MRASKTQEREDSDVSEMIEIEQYHRALHSTGENMRAKNIEIAKEKRTYAAPTHCWRVSGIPILTTQENLRQMLCRICNSSLTKTFQDAVSITRPF